MKNLPNVEVGDIVWCRFPERPRDVPGPKPRPALVVCIDDDGAVKVAYGTSQHLDHLHSGEFAIVRTNRDAYQMSGLFTDTKFDLKHTLTLPWDESFFAVPPHAPFGQSPKMGTLHKSLYKTAAAAQSALKR